jgi:prepilin-type N-terminal cleavage/methylation domain-containing protein
MGPAARAVGWCPGRPPPRIGGWGRHRRGASAGYSLVEMLVVVAVVAGGAALSVPVLTAAADAAEASAAARHVAGLIARARFEAARRNRVVALRFTTEGAEPAFTLVADGDGDGVSAADVTAGLDVAIRPPDRLSDHFAGARFAVSGALPAIDGDGMITGLDAPIRLGAAHQLSLGPLGTATSGTLYIASRRGVQYAVRIAGVTGRVRVLRYVPGVARWQPV